MCMVFYRYCRNSHYTMPTVIVSNNRCNFRLYDVMRGYEMVRCDSEQTHRRKKYSHKNILICNTVSGQCNYFIKQIRFCPNSTGIVHNARIIYTLTVTHTPRLSDNSDLARACPPWHLKRIGGSARISFSSALSSKSPRRFAEKFATVLTTSRTGKTEVNRIPDNTANGTTDGVRSFSFQPRTVSRRS